ncbi:MAG: TonB-dependent receptor plug domain-containing protein [Bacteroidales bacterium]|nr:TonB-dependent receptor plug domain-containing protein [Bacteroidales bacterium]
MVISGKELVADISLEEALNTLGEVTLTADIRKSETINELAMVSARTFSVEETERYAGSLGDPARMVANYAGVMTQNDSRNDIIIRGNSPLGVLWRLEGIEIPNPNHFGALGTTGGPVSMVNNNLLSNSDFLTGAFPAEFGNATAGAFDLNMRSGNINRTEFTGQIGFNGFEAGVEGPAFTLKNGQKATYPAKLQVSYPRILMHKIGFQHQYRDSCS